LLYGTDYKAGDNYRGVWGIYGSYDYLSPELFSVSSTALSVGIKYVWTRCDATYSDISSANQIRGEISIYYTCLGGGQFGTVDWRK
jgi:hypothetical protein